MVAVEEAIKLLQEEINTQTETIEVDVLEGNNCVIGEDIYSPISVPHFPKSGMDGYAIRSIDSQGATNEHPVTLEVIGEVLAGDGKSFQVKPHTAVRIMTGGEIPVGYDCVIKQELTNYGEDTVEIYASLEAGDNYGPIGEDIQEGTKVVEKYTRLTCAHLGVLVSMGIDKIKILRPMRVGIIATGSEIIKPGQPLGQAQVYSSSSYTIAGFLKSQGVEVVSMEVCIDEVDLMCKKIEDTAKNVDLLITTGAVSVGKKDIIPEVLNKIGAKMIFRKVDMKPGTPVLSSSYQEKLILSFSGNPFASFTNFQLFFWPVLAKYMNNSTYQLKRGTAIIKEGYQKSSKIRRFVRAYEENGEVRLVTRRHMSSVLSSVLDCNCLIDQSPDKELKEGDTVEFFYIKNALSFI